MLASLGSNTAKGRLAVGHAIDQIHADWAKYRGLTGRPKNWEGFVRFMEASYGAELDIDIFDPSVEGEEMDQIVAHVALKMLDNGQISISYG